MTPRDLLRFWAKVSVTDDCWLWIGAISSTGYGNFWLSGRYISAHRASYEYAVGPIPDGLHIDHLCRVRQCVNPSHLEPVTQRENTLRGETLPAANARKTHCLRDHPFTPENTYVSSAGRSCLTCRHTVLWPRFVENRRARREGAA